MSAVLEFLPFDYGDAELDTPPHPKTPPSADMHTQVNYKYV